MATVVEKLPVTASRLYQVLISAEVNGDNAPDMRDVLSHERQILHLAIESRDPDRIAAAVREGYRVAKMWGVDVA